MGSKYANANERLVAELNELTKNHLRVVRINGEGKRGRCVMECRHHGQSSEWGTPWLPSVATIKRGANCPKCTSRYRRTEAELAKHAKDILPSSLNLRRILTFNGSKSVCEIECVEHGLGTQWDNPWTPTVAALTQRNGCPKCGKSYRRSEAEATALLKQSLPSHLKCHGPYHDYANVRSPYIVECSTHGLGIQWGTPWAPSLNDILNHVNCPKCAGLYKSSEHEALIKINKETPSHITITGFVGAYKGISTECAIHCAFHGLSTEWGSPWTPTIIRLRDVNGCPKCSLRYSWTEKELLGQVNRHTVPGVRVRRILELKGVQQSVCQVECDIHGNASQWDPPWKPRIGNLIGKEIHCPMCRDITFLNAILEPLRLSELATKLQISCAKVNDLIHLLRRKRGVRISIEKGVILLEHLGVYHDSPDVPAVTNNIAEQSGL